MKLERLSDSLESSLILNVTRKYFVTFKGIVLPYSRTDFWLKVCKITGTTSSTGRQQSEHVREYKTLPFQLVLSLRRTKCPSSEPSQGTRKWSRSGDPSLQYSYWNQTGKKKNICHVQGTFKRYKALGNWYLYAMLSASKEVHSCYWAWSFQQLFTTWSQSITEEYTVNKE